MYKFPYQGKSLQECVTRLRDNYKKNGGSLEVMMWGVESLRDSPQDMKAYFDVLTKLTEGVVKKDVRKGKSTMAVQKVKAGMPVRSVAQELAYDHLRTLISYYNTEEIHEKWNAALPELKTIG